MLVTTTTTTSPKSSFKGSITKYYRDKDRQTQRNNIAAGKNSIKMWYRQSLLLQAWIKYYQIRQGVFQLQMMMQQY